MRFKNACVGLGLALGLVAGCSDAHEVAGDSGPSIGDTAPIHRDVGLASDAGAGEACGPVTCGPGTSCCNASCGICTPPGTGCIDLACADAGPPERRCGGIVAAPCDASEYCDYPDGSFCGGDDEQGICRPRPTECADPGGVPVCGCDGVDYLAACSANFAGTDVAHTGSCTTPPPSNSLSASQSCGPADGPAWDFTVTDGAPSCPGAPTDRTLSFTIWSSLDGASPGTVYTIGSSSSTSGQATYCPSGGGGPPCFVLTGTVTIDSFHTDTSASLSYDLVDFTGTHYAASHVSVGLWCPSHPLCG